MGQTTSATGWKDIMECRRATKGASHAGKTANGWCMDEMEEDFKAKQLVINLIGNANRLNFQKLITHF